MTGNLHKAGGEKHGKETRRKIEYNQPHRKWSGKFQYGDTYGGQHHYAVHHEPHILPVLYVKHKACRQTA